MRRVQCIDCRQVLSGRHHSTVYHVYCEGCCRYKLRRLESEIAHLRTADQQARKEGKGYLAVSKQVQFLCNWNHGHARQASSTSNPEYEFLPPLCDISLQASDGPRVPAHRAILAGKSPAFKAIFCKSNGQATQKRASHTVITVDDMSHEVLKAFVKFLYTAHIDPEIMEKHSKTLYCAGEKYGVKLLKKLCEDWIAKNVSDQNALSNLELAKQYGSAVVKDAVLQAASLQIDAIPSYAEYQTYVQKDPGLLIELYEGTVKMLSRKRSRKDANEEYQASTSSRYSGDCDSSSNDAN